MNLLVLIY